jgi:hypothetical protein
VAPLAVNPWSAAAWIFLVTGHPLVASAVAVASGEVLARRAGGDRDVAGQLRRLAAMGNLRAGAQIAAAVRRAWLPPALLAGAAAWSLTDRTPTRFSLAVSAGAALGGPALTDWMARRPPAGVAAWAARRLADDLAYQAGVWRGVVARRSGAALLPRW